MFSFDMILFLTQTLFSFLSFFFLLTCLCCSRCGRVSYTTAWLQPWHHLCQHRRRFPVCKSSVPALARKYQLCQNVASVSAGTRSTDTALNTSTFYILRFCMVIWNNRRRRSYSGIQKSVHIHVMHVELDIWYKIRKSIFSSGLRILDPLYYCYSWKRVTAWCLQRTLYIFVFLIIAQAQKYNRVLLSS